MPSETGDIKQECINHWGVLSVRKQSNSWHKWLHFAAFRDKYAVAWLHCSILHLHCHVLLKVKGVYRDLRNRPIYLWMLSCSLLFTPSLSLSYVRFLQSLLEVIYVTRFQQHAATPFSKFVSFVIFTQFAIHIHVIRSSELT